MYQSAWLAVCVLVCGTTAAAQPGYTISTFAGNGQFGSSGDGGPATSATLNSPRDIAMDASGNYYIADTGNHVIRKVTPNGVITTIAGNGFGSPILNNVPAKQSAVPFPAGLAFDRSGNLLITTGNRVRKLTPEGLIITVAGTGESGSTGDGGAALAATFKNPTGIVVDGNDNVFVSDNDNNRVRKITLGVVTTYAGTGGPFFTGDNGPAAQATIWGPEGLALDNAGNLHIVDSLNKRVRKVTANGIISTVAGGSAFTDAEEGGLATTAKLNWPIGIAVDHDGNLIVTEWAGAKIRQVPPQGAIYTMAGTGTAGYSGDGGTAQQAKIYFPRGPRTDGSGSVYFADEGNHRIRRLNLSTSFTVTPQTFTFAKEGGVNFVAVNAISTGWTATSPVPWIIVNGVNTAVGSGSVSFTVQANGEMGSRTGTLQVGPQTVTIVQSGTDTAVSAVRFVPVTPCRVLDTRVEGGRNGAFGPPILAGGASRDIPVPNSGCNIPATSRAYSVNVTVVPQGALSYLTLWPTGQTRPEVSTLNSFAGKVVANAALVPAGVNGSISVFATDATHVIIDINGYFTNTSDAYPFFTLDPCRVVETRIGSRPAGPLGAPSMTGGVTRDFPVPSGSCTVPAGARAYSLNLTVVPPGPLSYLTIWPTGISQPQVSTLNSFDGRVIANASLVPSGVNGAVSAFATNNTDLLMDINGYFASTGTNPLSFFPVAPCRVADTREGQGTTGAFGPPVMASGSTRSFPIPLGRCSISGTARAYSLNITVVPSGSLPYLTIWPSGQTQPTVSTLNSFDGGIVANAALVPAGAGGAVNVFVANTAHVIIDINGYFAP